jgi:2-oxoglutarate ferredoxin oxidoreductase subunit alpha
MLNLLPAEKGICLQGEDEIASIGFCIGASMGGLKAMTATSGPGISLFSEQISFAVGSEVPLVIVDVQRLGPSTGSATKGADGDIQFLRWGNSGGLPVIVLAPSDIKDCFTLTIHAFNLAETYRCPVFLASNKEIGMTRESIDLEQIVLPEPLERVLSTDPQSFEPYKPSTGSEIPQFMPMGGEVIVRQTSSTHGPDGYITVSTEHIAEGIRRMEEKISLQIDHFTYYEVDEEVNAETLIITYGVTSRAARDAVAQLRKENRKVSLLVLKTLYPVPENLLKTAIAKAARILVVEMNLGQYVREIERLVPNETVAFYGRMDGELISPEEIMGAAR